MVASDSVFHQHFGANVLVLVKPFLQGMIKGKSKSTWDRNYELARAKLIEIGAESKVTYLDTIYKNPTYYAGYVLHEMEGHCGSTGSTPAEQNHASVASQLADCSVMSLEKNREELCIRHARRMTERRELQSNWYIIPHQATQQNQHNLLVEMEGQKVLDRHPFLNMLLKKLNATQYLQMAMRHDADRAVYQVFPINETLELARTHGCLWEIDRNTRCGCQWRLSYGVQFEHELFVFRDVATIPRIYFTRNTGCTCHRALYPT